MATAREHSYFASKGQVKAIRTLASKIFRDDDEYHDALMSNYGVKSSKDLRYYEASEFINKLSRLAGSTPTSAGGNTSPSAGAPSYYGKGKKGRQRNLTPAQAERIEILKNILGWNEQSVLNFIHRQTRRLKGVQMLMNWEAVKVIVGMQRILSKNAGIEYSEINSASNKELKNMRHGNEN